MPTIKASTNNATGYFNLDGLDYEKGLYALFYDSVEINTSTVINYTNTRVGLRSKSEFNNILIKPKLVTDWTDGTTAYSDFDALIADITTLITAPTIGGGTGTAGGLSITQNVLNFAALVAGDTAGDLAYVQQSQGTQWLSVVGLGSYYPKGWYVWSGTTWISDRNAIVDQLQALVDRVEDEVSTASTGTVLSLTNKEGVLYNMGSANTATTYTTSGTTLNAYARVLINAASEPTVTGGTKITGSDFVISTDMYMTVWYNGVVVQFWFEEI